MSRLTERAPERFICPVCGEGIYEYVFRDAETREVTGCDICGGEGRAVSVYAADFSGFLKSRVF